MVVLVAHMVDKKQSCEFPSYDAMVAFVRACSPNMVPEVIELEIVGVEKGHPTEILTNIAKEDIQYRGVVKMQDDMFDFLALFK